MLPEPIRFQRDFAAAIDRPAVGATAVYRNTVLHGAVEALTDNYPVVAELLGADMFEAVAVDYAAECPPRSHVLALYGARFADWLEQQRWIADLPYLADVARVERLHVECLMAADAEPLSHVSGALGDLAGSRLTLHPALRFTWLATPAMTIWLAHQRPVTAELAPEWKPEGVLFARPNPFRLHSPRIGAPGHRLLCGLRLGERVGEAFAAVVRLYPDSDGPALLASFFNLGAFAAPAMQRT